MTPDGPDDGKAIRKNAASAQPSVHLLWVVQIADLSKPVKMDYKQRQEAAIQRDLKAINDLLDTAKSTKGRGIGDCWPAPLKHSDLGLTMLPGGRAAAAAATLRAGVHACL